ncbi:hypothetical protein [Novosphingobium sp. Leaf2]|uniref:hypothetical protein n=1 Tax=Novosphingobium sp. Leaf2 TaxID=1735670 RepID=UPI000A420CD5|nr:hypothetical protein [Novosphingobium sp. Leaf2]
MDMNHDFAPRPDLRADPRSGSARSRIWVPERMAIAGILALGWLTFMAHLFSGS